MIKTKFSTRRMIDSTTVISELSSRIENARLINPSNRENRNFTLNYFLYAVTHFLGFYGLGKALWIKHLRQAIVTLIVACSCARSKGSISVRIIRITLSTFATRSRRWLISSKFLRESSAMIAGRDTGAPGSPGELACRSCGSSPGYHLATVSFVFHPFW